MGLPKWQIKEPPTYKTWSIENGKLNLPRGGLQKVCEILTSESVKFEIVDKRSDGKKLKKGSTGKISRPLYPYQQTAIDILAEKQNCLLRAGTGCLAGDTIINVNRGGCCRKYKLKDIVQRFNGGKAGSKTWNLSIPTMVQSHYPDNTIRLNQLKGAYESGIKPVYRVTLANGQSIKASSTHPFFTNEGWKQTSELSTNLSVCVEKKASALLFKPFIKTSYVQVQSVELVGEEMTYDLEMHDEPRNFLANGMVVHNSGKTTMALAMVASLNVPSIVIVWSANLFDQWVKRCTSELGIPPKEIGMISGSKRIIKPVTIAMQQTLNSRGIDRELREYFGAVFVDEVQRASAPTLYSVIDPFPAKYRIGISADETRKDEKEFLIYDLFSKQGTDIPKEQLIQSGHVLDVEILIVPTDFKADWYDPLDWKNGFNRLLEEMETDDERNDLVASIVAQEVARNEQVMVLAHRRDHCRVLDAVISACGIESGFLIGGLDYKSVFQETLANIHSGKIKVGVGTVQAVGQALDIPTLGVAIAATPLATNRQQFGQVRGRVCRTAEGKTEAKLYYLWDQNVYGVSHIKNLIRWNSVVKVWHKGRWIRANDFLKLIK